MRKLIVIAGLVSVFNLSFAQEDSLSKAYYYLIRAKQELSSTVSGLDKDMVMKMLDSLIASVRKEIPDPSAIRNALLMKEEINKNLLSYDRLRHIVDPFKELAVVAPKVMSCEEADGAAKKLSDEVKRPTYVIKLSGLCRVAIGGFKKFEEAIRYGKRYFDSFNLYVVR